ncbi:MAG TPA: efflux RND transporter periplasmic adaptor subunit [Kiritimatiellia bacterium]|nr:efflux RND transporter periplasmic adaptor subunit [Kiritimatiellia bacterium]HRZ11829.1 efflux RND transporter periplasmic adaptor subunit [Kiritimatiellia bacterium]HSA17365.1 efflux RND transporter periplasmic adaptor subunit [Kiritimatiellia bacterium]
MKKLLLFLVLAAAAGVGWYGWTHREKAAVKAPSFEPVEFTRERIEVAIEATGVVEPGNRIEIKPPIGGRVEEVLVVEGQAVRQGEVIARMSSTDRAALLDAARAQGEAVLRKWEEVYKATPLIAPLDGTIIARKAEPGQTLTAADTALVLSDRLIVRAQVDETDIGLVRGGQEATLTLDAYADDRFRGQVRHIAYEATTVNNVTIYEVEVEPATVPERMKSGMTATVKFVVEAADDALTLPLDALVRRDGRSVVLLAPRGPGARPEEREVKTGLTGGGRVQILEGLDGSERVVRSSFDLPKRQESGSSPFMPRPPGRRP